MRILLDTNVFVAVKNKAEPFYTESSNLLEMIDNGKMECIVPSLVVAELCTGYYQEDDEEGAEELLAALLTTPTYKIIPMDHDIACKAGKIRARLGIRLPDAIVVATAITNKVTAIVTYDEEMKRAEKYIAVKTPKEIITR